MPETPVNSGNPGIGKTKIPADVSGDFLLYKVIQVDDLPVFFYWNNLAFHFLVFVL